MFTLFKHVQTVWETFDMLKSVMLMIHFSSTKHNVFTVPRTLQLNALSFWADLKNLIWRIYCKHNQLTCPSTESHTRNSYQCLFSCRIVLLSWSHTKQKSTLIWMKMCQIKGEINLAILFFAFFFVRGWPPCFFIAFPAVFINLPLFSLVFQRFSSIFHGFQWFSNSFHQFFDSPSCLFSPLHRSFYTCHCFSSVVHRFSVELVDFHCFARFWISCCCCLWSCSCSCCTCTPVLFFSIVCIDV